ncbi:MAG: hypothetical protein ACO3C1_02200 [Ilumatobacteraceae bacterium]
MHLAAHIRWLLARHPSVYWALVALTGLIVVLSVRSASDAATTERDRWGTSVVAYVTTGFVARGESVVAEPHDVPLALLPDGALVDAPPPGAVAAHDLAAGDVLDSTDVAESGEVPASWVVVRVSSPAPRLVAGDGVAVLGAGTLLCDGTVTDVRASDDGEVAIEVAMPPDCAEHVAPLLALDEVVLGRR